jgi:GNAT superfamily N-acetyltransferase
MENKEDMSLCEVHLHEGKHLPEGYFNLVKSRWVKTYRSQNDFMRLVDADAYYFYYPHYVESVMKRAGTEIRLVVLSDDHDVVLGFSVTEGNTLHYVHVPRDYRRQGIAKTLLPENLEWFTHITKLGLKLWPEKMPKLKFNPFK